MLVKTVGPVGAKIFFVGETPGEEEDKYGTPFYKDAPAGRTFNSLLTLAGISRAECLVGNVARERPPGNKISFFFEDKKCTIPKQILKKWIEDLRQEIDINQPNVIVALGGTALWALTGEKLISKFRGTVMESTLCPGIKVFPTYHPQAVNYTWPLHFTVVMDLRKAAYHSKFSGMPPDKRVLIEARNIDQFISYLREIKEDTISVDLEAAQPGSHITIVGVASSPTVAMSIKIVSGNHSRYSRGEELLLWRELGKVLTSKKLIMQNAAYDTGVLLLNHGINCINNLWMDTLLAAHCLWPETPRDLGYLASLCLDVPAWKHTAKDDPAMYNAADAANTFGIAEFLYKELKRTDNLKTFEFEMSEIAPSLLMQLKGIPVDLTARDELVKEHTNIYKETEAELNKILGKKINFNSSKQVQNLLYIDLGLPVQYKRRKKASDPRKITAGAEAIKKLSKLVPNNPIFNLLLKYKKSFKLVSSFLEIELSPTGRVHTSYNITGSATDDTGRKSFGRWSSSESIILPYGSGNLQNIPEEARKMYRAAPGYVILQVDKVQAEAVVVAYLANDFKLKKLFKDRFNAPFAEKGQFDVHKFTAVHMFGVKFEDVTKELRTVGKTLRHAVNYSAGPGVVSAKLGCTMTVAKQLLEKYFNINPQLRIWHQSIQNQLRENRTLTTPLGRKHKFLERWGDGLFRSAYSYIPQSTVGDLLNMDLVDIYNEAGKDIDILIQLHDSIYFHIPEKDISAVQKLCLKYMLRETEINHDTMIIEADFKAGPSWGEQESISY